MTRNEHTAQLLDHIVALRELLRVRHDAMVAAAIGTGHTSLVSTVRGIETALERAEHKVRRVTKEHTK